MSASITLIAPNLQPTFNVLIGWLQLDAPLKQDELITLASLFTMVAENETDFAVAASRTRTVFLCQQKMICTDRYEGEEDNVLAVVKGQRGVCFDRDGFFLFNQVKQGNTSDQSPLAAEIDELFDRAHPTRKMFLG